MIDLTVVYRDNYLMLGLLGQLGACWLFQRSREAKGFGASGCIYIIRVVHATYWQSGYRLCPTCKNYAL